MVSAVVGRHSSIVTDMSEMHEPSGNMFAAILIDVELGRLEGRSVAHPYNNKLQETPSSTSLQIRNLKPQM